MKWHITLFSLALAPTLYLMAQQQTLAPDALTGVYRPELDTTQVFNVKKEKDKLLLELVGQGQTTLIPLGNNRYKPELVQPATILEFIKDSLGRVQKFNWLQDSNLQLVKISTGSDTSGYGGRYQAKNNPYVVLEITGKNNILSVRQGKATSILMQRLSGDQFIFEKEGLKIKYEFTRNRQGDVRDLVVTRTGPQVFLRVTGAGTTAPPYGGQVFTDHHPFTRADSLRGMLTPERTCYDVLFYDLQLRVIPEEKLIAGSNTIRFKVVQPFSVLQVDLFACLHIDKIQFHGQPLAYQREYNAIFIRFPQTMQSGTEDSITIDYSGQPREPDLSKLQGGFIWWQDKNGTPWIESVCQGSGASLWWPCKDHQSDKPDSMHIAVTVPDTLMDISNGTLQQVTMLPDHLKRFDWFVHYPINNYDVAVNIGKYNHDSETYINGQDSMTLHYYYLSYNESFAKYLFKGVPPMIALYEKNFGPYPFKKDGFKLLEAPYPMEHQGAVSVGSFSYPPNSGRYDTAECMRVAWHESAHEWWGNSVTCNDITELWMHEAFATYAEILCYENFAAPEAAQQYVREQIPGNKEPIIGTYGVNDFHTGDMYSKGARMLLTLQGLIANDSLWFGLLKKIQQHFRYRSINTQDLVSFINRFTGQDLTAFFDQYLRYKDLPGLLLKLIKKGDSLEVRYKWKVDVRGFHMPVKVTTAKNNFLFIYPTTQWKTMQLPRMKPGDFQIDTDHFLIKVNRQ
jgi:hypothetical protein